MDESVAQILSRFPSRRLLVLGDVILDRYWWGDSHRLSPEAPVPVVRKQRTTLRPGGAANTAANLAALGAQVRLCGVTGDDQAGSELRQVLTELGIAQSLLIDAARPTTSKTRIVAAHQHVVRVDEEDTAPLAAALEAQAIAALGESIPKVDAVVVSDYAKGFLDSGVLAAILRAAGERGIPVFVDPNRLELGVLTQRHVRNHAETLEAGRFLATQMPGSAVLVTEGAEGMTVFLPHGREEHVASVPQQVFDVTGAGDTVLATVALALTSGASHRQALELAARAASIAVGVLGTSAVTREELSAALA
jgi:D-beta-D-heptose 7-phosphate kinase/D-beta-D-heptose 1-phosphate adenosyltransferase